MITRQAAETLKKMARQFRAVAIVGPRQSGKSTLAKAVFSTKRYVSLENPEIQQRAADDPRGFLHHYNAGAIIDEAQRVPELFNYLQQVLDESSERGKFILSGSNNFLMLEKITQSLAGRIGYLDLLPFSYTELKAIHQYPIELNNLIYRGGYPPVTYEGVDEKFWFPAYVRTYIERDVRQIKNITDLATFQRFMFLCAARIGQQVNLSNLAMECGIDHKTAQSWLSVMQASYIVHLLQPYYKNYSKRIVKSPKLYFYDTGLASYLLGIESADALLYHAMRGALFENFIINELLKSRFNQGLRSNLFYWRDVSGHELDVIIESNPEPVAVEIKSGLTANDEHFKGLRFWNKLNPKSKKILVYGGDESYNWQSFVVTNWRDLSVIA
ncbi:MAG: ATP-binding protein [Cyclobacteriaceae bacterium]|nr:ATP-binding protein [Cyclobacteriaceae bacterium]QOI97146.1 MAG: ATP-binding protein [Flammeovirgaceae bacterium]